MHKLFRRRFFGVVALGAILAAAAGVGLATGSLGGGSEIVQACAHKTTGALRMVQTGQDCLASEVAVTWNVRGPEGPQGPAGVGQGAFRERLTGGPMVGTTEVLTMDVVAQRSTLFAIVQLINTSITEPREGVCDLISPDGTARRGFVSIAPNSKAQLILINVGTSAGTATITCYAPADGSLMLDVPTSLSAIELSTLDVQP